MGRQSARAPDSVALEAEGRPTRSAATNVVITCIVLYCIALYCTYRRAVGVVGGLSRRHPVSGAVVSGLLSREAGAATRQALSCYHLTNSLPNLPTCQSANAVGLVMPDRGAKLGRGGWILFFPPVTGLLYYRGLLYCTCLAWLLGSARAGQCWLGSTAAI